MKVDSEDLLHVILRPPELNALYQELIKRKLFDRETYEEVIRDLVEDTKELNDQGYCKSPRRNKNR